METEGPVPDIAQDQPAPRGGPDPPKGVRAVQARKRAFLALENRREALTGGLTRRSRRAKRYRDLIMTIAVIRLQRRQLVEPTTRRWPAATDPAHDAGDPVEDAEVLADWARPWGGACLLELQADFESYRRERDQVERWLTRRTKERAKADAAERLRAIRMDVAEAVRDRTPAGVNGVPPERRYSRHAHNPAARLERRRGSVG